VAEVVNVPKVNASSLTRETSTLSKPIKKEDKPAIEKVELKGAVVKKRPSFFSKLKETFIADDARDVGDYIVWDIIVPTIRRTIRDVIVGSADRIFLGTSSPNNSSVLYRERGVTRVRTDYSGKSTNASKIKPAVETNVRRPTRVNFHLNEIVFNNYDDASSVLERLVDYLDTYGKVSVDDYFDLVGQSSDFTAQDWGWTSLSSATIVNTYGGYFIKLPNPIVIKE